MWNREKRYRLTYLQSKDGSTDVSTYNQKDLKARNPVSKPGFILVGVLKQIHQFDKESSQIRWNN